MLKFSFCENKYNMRKNQKQSLVRKHNSDYYKAFKSRTHLITMLFCILSRDDSMTEICEGMRALGPKRKRCQNPNLDSHLFL